MELAVILSVYYKEKARYLDESLSSIFNQSFVPSEVVLVEDGPLNDELYGVVSKYKTRYTNLKVISLENNQGLAHALNLAITNTRAKYIARMDTDDVSKRERFEKQISFLNDNPDVDCVGTWAIEIKADGSEFFKKQMPLSHDECRRFYMKRNPMIHPTVMFRRSYFEKAGIYPEYTYQEEDTMLWANGFANGCRFANIPEYLYEFRIDDSFFHRRKGFRFAKDTFLIRHKIRKMLHYPFKADVYAFLFAISKMMPGPMLKLIYKIVR